MEEKEKNINLKLAKRFKDIYFYKVMYYNK